LAELDLRPSPREIDELILKYDASKDGSLQLSEFENLVIEAASEDTLLRWSQQNRTGMTRMRSLSHFMPLVQPGGGGDDDDMGDDDAVSEEDELLQQNRDSIKLKLGQFVEKRFRFDPSKKCVLVLELLPLLLLVLSYPAHSSPLPGTRTPSRRGATT